MKKPKHLFLSGKPITHGPIPKNVSVTKLVDDYFQAYNSGRLREASHLYTKLMLKNDVTIGMSLTGALTPAGLGGTCIVPLIKSGFVDWIVSSGANLYHDAHFALGHTMHCGSPFLDDKILRKEGVVRIYDILFDYNVLLSTDEFFRKIIRFPEFQTEMSTSELHYKIGRYILERERVLKIKNRSILSAAYLAGVPIYTSAPGDSSIGMNIAEIALSGYKTRINVLADVNETAAIVLNAKRNNGKSGVLIVGGGSPKNFLLQTEPHLQEVLKIDEKGHDYFLQITDARPDTGGLSGATPSEAVSWGKINPDQLSNTVVIYSDSTIILPIITSYALGNVKPRKLKRLYHKREFMLKRLQKEYTKYISKKNNH
jgi:deoxyhypusine synthase